MADLFCALRWEVEREVVTALGDQLPDVLLHGLERPERLGFVLRFVRPEDRLRHSIVLLGRLGDARAADTLRRFAEATS